MEPLRTAEAVRTTNGRHGFDRRADGEIHRISSTQRDARARFSIGALISERATRALSATIGVPSSSATRTTAGREELDPFAVAVGVARGERVREPEP